MKIRKGEDSSWNNLLVNLFQMWSKKAFFHVLQTFRNIEMHSCFV